MPLRMLVAGAGIGGLTAAIALKRAGHEVAVFERAPELLAVGAGISIQPNAVVALRQIGVGDAVVAAGRSMRDSTIRRFDGRVLSALPLEALYARVGAPSVAIHRATLQRVLLAAAGDVVRLGAPIAAHEATPTGGVRIRLHDGTHHEGDALIGADGLRSTVRAQLFPERASLRHAGYHAWRGVTTGLAGLAADTSFLSWGRGLRFGAVEIDGDRTYWFALVNGPKPHDAPAAAPMALLTRLFGAWHAPIPSLLAATSHFLCDDIHELPPLRHWGNGRVTLLGDAAHAMTPNLGQGACQAIEDAVILADCLSPGDTDPATALRTYEGLRRARVIGIQKGARRLGAVGQLANPVLCALRNLAMRATPTAVAARRMEAIWTYPGAEK